MQLAYRLLGMASLAAACNGAPYEGSPTSQSASACASPIGLRQSIVRLEGDCSNFGSTSAIQAAGGVLGEQCAARRVDYFDDGCTLEFEGRSCVTAAGDAVTSFATLHARDDGTWSGVAEISIRAHTGPFDHIADDPLGAAVRDCAGTFLIELVP